MFSTTVSVTLAVCFISFVSGPVLEPEVANKATLKCAGSEWHSDVSVDESEEGPKNEDEILKAVYKS